VLILVKCLLVVVLLLALMMALVVVMIMKAVVVSVTEGCLSYFHTAAHRISSSEQLIPSDTISRNGVLCMDWEEENRGSRSIDLMVYAPLCLGGSSLKKISAEVNFGNT
jgi:hypothetical protein